VVKSLGTSDLAEATRRYATIRAEMLATFEDARAARAPKTSVSPLRTRREIIDHYRIRRFDDLRLERGDVVSRCLSDRDAFYEGKILPLPTDDRVKGNSFWHDVACSGDFSDEVAVLYALERQLAKRAEDLERKAELGDASEFLSFVPETFDERDRRLIALDLQETEIELLKGAKPVLPADVLTQQSKWSPVSLPAVSTTSNGPAPMMSEVFPRFRSEHASIKTRVELIEGLVHELSELFGDKPINGYTPADARSYKDVLLALPPNWRKLKEFRGLSIADAVGKAKGLKVERPQEATVANKLGALRQLFKWIGNEYGEYDIRNPFAEVRMPKGSMAANEARDPFSTEQLRAIFAAPLFTGAHSETRWREPGTVDLKGHPMRWLIVLGLYTGARLGELAQLTKANVRKHDDIHYLCFDPSMKLKKKPGVRTSPSVRNVPLHLEVIRAGFLDYIAQLKDERLFSFPTRGGRFSDAAGKAFNRMLVMTGVKTKTTNFHSFRHNFTDACRRVPINPDIRERMIGHALEGMASRYGSDYRGEIMDMGLLSATNVELQKVEYPEVKLARF
jgi:integrase